MASLSANQFFGGKVPPPPPPAPTPPHPLDGFGISDQIKNAFSSAIGQAGAGYNLAAGAGNEIAKGGLGAVPGAAAHLLEGGAGLAAGGINAVLSPLAPALNPTLGAATNFIGDKISDSPAVQKFALSPAGETTSRIAQDVSNLDTIAGAVAGGKAGSAVKGAAADLKGASIPNPVKSLGKGLETTGQKIQQTVIKPSARDISDGFKIENVAKYDVGGSLPETITKTHAKLNDLTSQLNEKLQGSNTAVNLNHTLDQTIQNLTSNKSRAFGDNAAIERVIGQLKDEIHKVSGQNGLVDLVEATNVKRGAGTKGAWSFNRPEADASAIEKVYTEFYDVLKQQIEQAAPDGVKDINKQLSELIPIQNAALRRLPVEQRNHAISLTDSIGLMASVFDPKALLIMGATKAAKSGRVGNALQKAGAKMQGK